MFYLKSSKEIMLKRSLLRTVLINLCAFLLVVILEILGGWLFRDQYDSDYHFYVWQLSYAMIIMIVIWINHYILIPLLYDKKHYLLYGVFLLIVIFLAAYFKGFTRSGWIGLSKMFFFLFYTTGTGMAAFFLSRNVRIQKENSEKEKLKNEMEINYLKAQVNPHFLFNALNSIYSLSREQSVETPDLVMQLSELMRYQLESTKQETVLLLDELRFLENYLLLEEKRLSDRCAVEFNIEGELDNLRIAPLLLIPFIENAIKHGAQSTSEQSTIDISISVDIDTFYFHVENSKPLQAINTNREGIGLVNVKRRLNLLYLNHYVLEIKDNSALYTVSLSIDLKVLHEENLDQ